MIPSWEELIERSSEKGIRLATAESCTGGLISSLITDVPGSSDAFIGGVVVYSNELKSLLLGVDRSTLSEFGAVSRESAEEMVHGLQRSLSSDLSLAVTGIAGPGGGTDDKPVGTVYIGVKRRGQEAEVEGFHLRDLSRKEFKERVAEISLGMLLGHLS